MQHADSQRNSSISDVSAKCNAIRLRRVMEVRLETISFYRILWKELHLMKNKQQRVYRHMFGTFIVLHLHIRSTLLVVKCKIFIELFRIVCVVCSIINSRWICSEKKREKNSTHNLWQYWCGWLIDNIYRSYSKNSLFRIEQHDTDTDIDKLILLFLAIC